MGKTASSHVRTPAQKRSTRARRAKVVPYSPEKPESTATNGLLRNVKQISYPAVCAWSEAKCKAFLLRKRVLPPRPFVKRTCAVDGKVLKGRGKMKHCTKRGCGYRLSHADVAYTPLHSLRKRGSQANCKDLVRISYLIGVKSANDSAQHLSGLHRGRCDRYFSKIRFALAFAEKKAGEKVTFDREVGELDTAKFRTDRRAKDSRVHQGRTLCFKGRSSKQKALVPLPNRKVRGGKGGRGIVTERKDEIIHAAKRVFKNGSVQTCDSSPAFKAINKELKNVPIVTVRHGSGKTDSGQRPVSLT